MRSIGYSLKLVVAILLLASFAVTTPTIGKGQDQSFRLINIERRLDQLQTRIDYLDRSQQSQSLSGSSSNATTASILELQRQQLSLAEQVVTMQRKMLEMQKTIDRLTEQNRPLEKPEKKDKPEEKPKPKIPAGRP
jgi:uncharacterized protein HemX